jgi:hypothetical protein
MSSANCECNRCFPKSNDSIFFAEWDDTDCVVLWVGCQKFKMNRFEADTLAAQLEEAAKKEDEYIRCPMGYTSCGVCGITEESKW